jgi:hypothetical protein
VHGPPGLLAHLGPLHPLSSLGPKASHQPSWPIGLRSPSTPLPPFGPAEAQLLFSFLLPKAKPPPPDREPPPFSAASCHLLAAHQPPPPPFPSGRCLHYSPASSPRAVNGFNRHQRRQSFHRLPRLHPSTPAPIKASPRTPRASRTSSAPHHSSPPLPVPLHRQQASPPSPHCREPTLSLLVPRRCEKWPHRHRLPS